ncbi:MAG TPA: major capsid protein [Pyrinomonadaceae bacterium]|nr:major capsid protein [Pyrinomonadaceae bacterium]
MADETTPEAFNASVLSDEELRSEYTRVRDRGTELSAKDTLTPEETTELTSLAAHVTAVNTELSARTEAAAALQATRETFATLPDLAPAAVPAPVAPAAPAEPVIEPTAVVTASVPSVAQLPPAPAPVAPVRPSRGIVSAFVSSGAAGYAGKQVNEEFDGLTDISKALIANAQSMGRVGGGQGSRQAIAQFRRDRGTEFRIDTDSESEAYSKLKHARDESRLHGGSLAKQWQKNIDEGVSLTAAAGWCAPSENDYDLCRQWADGVGILDLPTVTVTRGGLNYTDEPDFPTIYANAVAAGGGSNFLTEAQVIADTVKTCSEIPCPTFENRRLDVMALCIRVSFLQAAGYPEVVNAWQDGLLAAHGQEMNRLILADLIARAGAATVAAAVDPDGTDSFTSALLAGVELAAEDIRYRFMMPWSATVEIVLPHWVLPQIRADLSRRNGVSMLAVTDSEIANMFSVRNVRVQFVRGWQDGLITGGALNAAFPGGDAATPFLTALPSTVSFLAYPAGSVAVARQDVVTLTNVYDAASLSTNEFTALFAEEGFAPVYPCPGQRLYTITGCIAGPTGVQNIDCLDAA